MISPLPQPFYFQRLCIFDFIFWWSLSPKITHLMEANCYEIVSIFLWNETFPSTIFKWNIPKGDIIFLVGVYHNVEMRCIERSHFSSSFFSERRQRVFLAKCQSLPLPPPPPPPTHYPSTPLPLIPNPHPLLWTHTTWTCGAPYSEPKQPATATQSRTLHVPTTIWRLLLDLFLQKK